MSELWDIGLMYYTSNWKGLFKGIGQWRIFILAILLPTWKIYFVNRRSHTVLRGSLPPKVEYVLLVKMTPMQKAAYKRFMDEVIVNKFASSNPLKAFAVCCKIWNHTDVLYNYMSKCVCNSYHLSGRYTDFRRLCSVYVTPQQVLPGRWNSFITKKMFCES